MNQEVFKQAQSRGWMEGWEFSHTYLDQVSNLLPINIYVFTGHQANERLTKTSTLNNILFGTDFCEKFFKNVDNCCLGETFPEREVFGAERAHKIAMLSMSEPERIAFLEKHLEMREKPAENGIEFIKSVEFNTVEKTLTQESSIEIFKKINQIIAKVNDNTKAISACAKDCKLNRN